MRRGLLAFAGALFVAGCANAPVAPVPGSPVASVSVPPVAVASVPAPGGAPDEESRQVVELIGFSQRVLALAAEDQRRELVATGQQFARERSLYSRVRLALLLATPGSAVSDDARALGLLEPVGAGAQQGTLRQFASLLLAQVTERVKEQRRALQMKEQLDALRDVERSIINRGRAR